MSLLSIIVPVTLSVAATTISHYVDLGNSRADRERRLLVHAARAARRSETASRACIQLSNASSELSQASNDLLVAAGRVRSEDRVFLFVCLYLYGKFQFYRAGWLLGRAMQLSQQADAKFRESKAITDWITRDA